MTAKWSNYVIMWFKKWISDIKFHQNHGKLSFSMAFIDCYINYDPKRFIQNIVKWSNMIMIMITKPVQDTRSKSARSAFEPQKQYFDTDFIYYPWIYDYISQFPKKSLYAVLTDPDRRFHRPCTYFGTIVHGVLMSVCDK